MRDLRFYAVLAGLLGACFFAAKPASGSSSDNLNGASCQLSIPTTDTGVRPKASGFRNESRTTGNFVICTLQTSSMAGNYSSIVLVAYSLDGMAHNLSCTTVVGALVGGNTLVYSTKTASIHDTTGNDLPIMWTASDFGGPEGDPITSSWNNSITCNLPPQTAISLISARTP
jgi:hypothetical protein